MTFAIETKELRKVFGDNAAVKSLTLQVQQGEVFGFLGPNGAGKTTSIKMLLSLIAPTSGRQACSGQRSEIGRCAPGSASCRNTSVSMTGCLQTNS